MSELKIELIASDIDGTILPFGANQVESKVFELIHEIRERGIYFFLASGRQYHQIRRLFAPVADEIGYVAENGCLAYIDGELIHHATMDLNLAREIVRTAQTQTDYEIVMSSKRTYYMQPRREDFYRHVKDEDLAKVERVENLLEVEDDILKVSLFKGADMSSEEFAFWKDRFGSKCTVQTSGNFLIDIVGAGVNKATALKSVFSRLGVDEKNVVAFGDNDNDRQMLEFVGCPIAMENARDEIKSIGKFTTSSVAKSLEKILRGELLNF